jgi:MFS family permease
MTSPTTSTGPGAQRPLGERKAALAAIVLASFLASLDNNIVSTALPTITSDLGGVRDYTWVSTAYLLAAAISVPIIGKLGDLAGRKRLFLISLAIFLVGSALSGASTSIVSLTAFRALQGIGGGGLVVTAMASFAELFAPDDRGRYQGYFAAVLAVSTVGGPVLGGAIADGPGWRWIFYLNLPLGAFALVLAATRMQLASPARNDGRNRQSTVSARSYSARGSRRWCSWVLRVAAVTPGHRRPLSPCVLSPLRSLSHGYSWNITRVIRSCLYVCSGRRC